MKHILFILLSVFTLTSCLQYAEPKLLSLSGEYVIDKIVYEDRDNDSSTIVFYPGDLYVNPSETKPLDSIKVGITKLALDYSVIYFDPTDTPSGTTTWGKNTPIMFTVIVHFTNLVILFLITTELVVCGKLSMMVWRVL